VVQEQNVPNENPLKKLGFFFKQQIFVPHKAKTQPFFFFSKQE